MRFFSGVRLSTREQEALVADAIRGGHNNYGTGDTLVVIDADGYTAEVCRYDFDVQLTAAERKAWLALRAKAKP